jgi:hypothetical protein
LNTEAFEFNPRTVPGMGHLVANSSFGLGMNVFANIPDLMQQKYVRVGLLFVPPSQITTILSRYVHQLVCMNDDGNFPYSFCGSSTLFCLNGRYFSAFCQHQIKDHSPDQVTWFPHAANGKEHIGGGVFRSIIRNAHNDDEEFTDVCAIECEPHKYKIGNYESEFFPVVADECWPSNSLSRLIVFGCLTVFQDLRISAVETELKLNEMNLNLTAS